MRILNLHKTYICCKSIFHLSVLGNKQNITYYNKFCSYFLASFSSTVKYELSRSFKGEKTYS